MGCPGGTGGVWGVVKGVRGVVRGVQGSYTGCPGGTRGVRGDNKGCPSIPSHSQPNTSAPCAEHFTSKGSSMCRFILQPAPIPVSVPRPDASCIPAIPATDIFALHSSEDAMQILRVQPLALPTAAVGRFLRLKEPTGIA